MKDIFLQFRVSGQTLERADSTKLYSMSKNLIYCQFDYSDHWDGETIIAIFRVDDEVYKVQVEKNWCLVPWECLRKQGQFSVSIFAGDLITTNMVNVNVGQSGYTEEAIEGDAPTPVMWDEWYKELQERATIEYVNLSVEELKEQLLQESMERRKLMWDNADGVNYYWSSVDGVPMPGYDDGVKTGQTALNVDTGEVYLATISNNTVVWKFVDKMHSLFDTLAVVKSYNTTYKKDVSEYVSKFTQNDTTLYEDDGTYRKYKVFETVVEDVESLKNLTITADSISYTVEHSGAVSSSHQYSVGLWINGVDVDEVCLEIFDFSVIDNLSTIKATENLSYSLDTSVFDYESITFPCTIQLCVWEQYSEYTAGSMSMTTSITATPVNMKIHYTTTGEKPGGEATIDVNISGNAATATKATQDSSGNVITDTYSTKKANVYTNKYLQQIASGTELYVVSTSADDTIYIQGRGFKRNSSEKVMIFKFSSQSDESRAGYALMAKSEDALSITNATQYSSLSIYEVTTPLGNKVYVARMGNVYITTETTDVSTYPVKATIDGVEHQLIKYAMYNTSNYISTEPKNQWILGVADIELF